MAPTTVHLHHRREEESIGKPTHPDGLILEAWAQGFMVGALIVMACITVANMRKGVILHKLILTEVNSKTAGGERRSSCPKDMRRGTDKWILAAHPRYLPRNIHLSPSAGVWLVPVGHGHLPQHFVEPAQRDCVDQDQAVPNAQNERTFHHHPRAGAELLGSRDLRQLCLLQQHQQAVPKNAAAGGAVSVSIFVFRGKGLA